MEQKFKIIANNWEMAEEFYLPFKPSVGDKLHIGSLREVTPDDKLIYSDEVLEIMSDSYFVVSEVVVAKWKDDDLEISISGSFEKILKS